MTDPVMQKRTDDFARALTDLCRDHGLGIVSGTLFVMEPEDYAPHYRVNEDSELVLVLS